MKGVSSSIKFFAVLLLFSSVLGITLSSFDDFSANKLVFQLVIVIAMCLILYTLGELLSKQE